MRSGLRGSAMQRAAASSKPSLRSVAPKQHDSAIAGDAATIKTTLHNASAKLTKFNLACLRFFGTVWHWQSSVVIGVRYQ